MPRKLPAMLPTTHQRMSAADYRQMPEGPPHFQLIKGELFMSPSPQFWHQEIVGNIFAMIRQHLRTHPVGKVVVAPSDVELSAEDVLQPDIYFVSKDRLHIITAQGATGAPDLVVEVLSPATAKLDRGPKLALYSAAGVRELWLVNAREKKIDVLELEQQQLVLRRTVEPGGRLETPLIPELILDVAEIFAS